MTVAALAENRETVSVSAEHFDQRQQAGKTRI
jgi:hypothetical protein